MATAKQRERVRLALEGDAGRLQAWLGDWDDDVTAAPDFMPWTDDEEAILRRAVKAIEARARRLEECPAGGPHDFREHDESPRGPSRVVHCSECGANP